MSSELDDFLQTLARIARQVIDLSLTLLCALLLLLAALVPWRLPYILTPWTWMESLQKFQAHAAWHFVWSLADVFICAFVLPSIFWPIRWPLHWRAVTMETMEQKEFPYETRRRMELLSAASTCYLDLLALPAVLLLLLSPWRFSHTPWLLEDLRGKTFQQSLTVLRTWAAGQGLNGLLDWPFVAVGLTSLCVPTRWPAWVNVLFVRKGYKDSSMSPARRCNHDWEFRFYQLHLPLLSLADLGALLAVLLALLNPLRLASLRAALRQRTPGAQESALQWDLAPRRAVWRVALTSLMDLLLLPLALLVCVSYYRAGPLLEELRCAMRQRPCGYIALTDDEEILPTKLQQVTMRQFGLLLLDVLTLPCLLLVILTWYRYGDLKRASEKRWGVLSHHVLLLWNAMVVLHDLFLTLCCATLLLTLYRLPRLWRLRSEQRPRKMIWQELGNLLLDLPLLPLFLLLILSLWRADLVAKAVWRAEDNCQRRSAVLQHFVELLRDLLAFLALALLALTLLRLPKVLLDIYARCGRPPLGVPRFALRSVRISGGDAQDGRLTVTAEGSQPEVREEMGVVRINIVSQGFWDEISRVFGSSITSVGRALLPFTLKDGKHLNYSDFLPMEASVQLKMGGRELKSKLMQLDPNMAMCVQIQHKTREKEEILMRLPIPTRLLHEAAQGNVVQVPEELLTAEVEEICGPTISGGTLREVMWLCAFMEFWQLVLDITHVCLFLLLLLAPWRLAQCGYFLAKPIEAWEQKLRRDTLSLMHLKEGMLRLASSGLEKSLGEAVKDPQCRTAELCAVASGEFFRAALPSQRVELKDDFGMMAERYLALQDALVSYWPGLVLGANLLLAAGQLSPHEHAMALEKIAAARGRARASGDHLLANLAAAQQSGGGKGCKGLEEQRHLIRRHVREALKDYGTLLLSLLLLLTFYRLVPLARQWRSEQRATREQRLRVVLKCQGRLFAWDLWLLFSTLLASLGALLTLVRAVEFLGTLWRCNSLLEVRTAALESLKEALNCFYELLTLLTFWETYKTLVRASIYSLLLPAWGMKPLPHWCRILLWLGLCTLPWLTSGALFCYAGLVGLFFGLHLVRKGCRVDGQAAYLKTMRLTGPNLWTLLWIVADTVILSSLSSVPWKDAFIAAAVVTVLWLLVLALPPHGRRGSILLLLRRCMLPCMLVLLAHETPQAVLLLSFLAFTAVLGHELLCQEPIPLDLDLAQAPIFLSGLLLSQVVYAHALLHGQALLAAFLSLLAPFWVVIFQVFGGPGGVGGPLWLLPLQVASSSVPALFTWARHLQLNQQQLWTGLSVGLLLLLAFLVLCTVQAQRWRYKALEENGMLQLLERLQAKLGCTMQHPSPHTVAQSLKELESSTPMERLSRDFLQRRKQWLKELPDSDYAAVAQQGQELFDAFVTPPSTVQIFTLMRRKSGRRVPAAIWQMILEYVSDVRPVSELLNPVINAFYKGPPEVQLERALQLMQDLSVRKSSHVFQLARTALTRSAPVGARAVVRVNGFERRGHVAKSGRNVTIQIDNEGGSVTWKKDVEAWLEPTVEDRMQFLSGWQDEVFNKVCNLCDCGRPKHPPTVSWWRPCYKFTHERCCRSCGRNHTQSCEARARQKVEPWKLEVDLS